ncbi:MAG: hypothetical protein CMA72_04220, partial [Euryarchaeota archaeon]|nr:hypothetical protein [Euryarchaeota archaeon]
LSFISNTDTLKYSDGNFIKAMHIDSGGNVGIGTTNPGYKLDVHGTSNVGALTATSVSGDGSGLTSLNASNVSSGTLTRPISTTTGVFTSTGNAVRVGPYGGGQVGLTINDGDGNCSLTFNHASLIPDQNGSSGRIDCGVDGTSGYMRLRVKDNVTGGTSTGNLPECVRIEEGYVRAYSDFYAGGNVGIGTNSPATKLHVAGGTIINSNGVAKKTYSYSGTLSNGQTIANSTIKLTFTNHVFSAKIVAHLVESPTEVSTISFECCGGHWSGSTPSTNIATSPVTVFGPASTNPWNVDLTLTSNTVSLKPTTNMAAAGAYNVFVEYISQNSAGELSSLHEGSTAEVSDFGY